MSDFYIRAKSNARGIRLITLHEKLARGHESLVAQGTVGVGLAQLFWYYDEKLVSPVEASAKSNKGCNMRGSTCIMGRSTTSNPTDEGHNSWQQRESYEDLQGLYIKGADTRGTQPRDTEGGWQIGKASDENSAV